MKWRVLCKCNRSPLIESAGIAAVITTFIMSLEMTFSSGEWCFRAMHCRIRSFAAQSLLSLLVRYRLHQQTTCVIALLQECSFQLTIDTNITLSNKNLSKWWVKLLNHRHSTYCTITMATWLCHVFAPIIGHMANFHSHRFPGTLKTAQVLPCRRSHAWTRMILLAIDQYPINLSTISKILERLALNSLRPQMLGLPLYCKLQSAYRRGHSTETALLHILNGVYSALDSKRAALLVVLDISAAFNTISHSLLLCCLESDYGVRSNVLKWIQSYVMERIQFVKLGRHTSATSPCTASFPL